MGSDWLRVRVIVIGRTVKQEIDCVLFVNGI
jgi:hypothetical protein